MDDTPEERIDKANNAREIVHKNTRFIAAPFSADKNKQSLSGAASAQARVLAGQVGPDGKEILPAESPRVGGYGFVATPSPAPGKTFWIFLFIIIINEFHRDASLKQNFRAAVSLVASEVLFYA